MGPRPAHLNLRNGDGDESGELQRPKPPFYADLPSPRSGDIPPALSPLDAFAMHSRALARRLEGPPQGGRRISRLPHSDVAKELANRPDYFRSVSGSGSDGGMSDVPELKEESPTSPQMGNLLVTSQGDAKDRPVSHYPMFGNAGRAGRERQVPTPMETALETPVEFFDAPEEHKDSQTRGYFGIGVPRASSPEPVDPKMVNVQAPSPSTMPSLTNSIDSVQSTQPRTLTDESQRPLKSLRPPKSPAYPKSPRSIQSVRSVAPDSDVEDGSVNSSQAVSSSRNFSGSSGMSRPQSPYSPFMPPMHRSPSMTSEYSTAGSQRRNFSRPPIDTRPSFDSRSSFETRPSTELPLRHPSAASGSTNLSSSVSSRQASQDDTPTPFSNVFLATSTPKDDAASGDYFDVSRPTTSYVYSKYALPRGRTVERNSRGTRDSWIQRQFTWDDVQPAEPLKQPQNRPSQQFQQQPQEQSQQQPLPQEQPQQQQDFRQTQWIDVDPSIFESRPRPPSPTGSEKFTHIRQDRISRERGFSSANRSRSADTRMTKEPGSAHKSTPSVKTQTTVSTDRTIKAVPLHERSPSAELTPDEHLEVGIQAHSSGQLQKSTYHLRLAAKAGLPTAMLLYALACRHGWGMRPNQEEGVMWLRKAVDGSGLEVADVEGTLNAASREPKTDPGAEALERKRRKAQFALAIYELGISYMNGWGCPKDKPLAGRCFEVAGSWGDCDALAEAGFCYTQGVGCKKDLKKAAALYRKAADGGMSMAGNSWIYKSKYMEEASKTPEKEKKKQQRADADASKEGKDKEAKPAGRSRARSIWGRKKDKSAAA